jgi:hypothetical protein
MSGEPNAVSKSLAEVTSHMVMIGARIALQVWRNGLQLWKVPLEFSKAEDASLGVWQTSVYFKAPADERVCLRCVSVKEVPTGRSVDVGLVQVPDEYKAGPEPQAILLKLPRNVGAGLYEVTLENETTHTTESYLMPFGVPGRRR